MHDNKVVTLPEKYLPDRITSSAKVRVLNVYAVLGGASNDLAALLNTFDFNSYDEGDIILIAGLGEIMSI